MCGRAGTVGILGSKWRACLPGLGPGALEGSSLGRAPGCAPQPLASPAAGVRRGLPEPPAFLLTVCASSVCVSVCVGCGSWRVCTVLPACVRVRTWACTAWVSVSVSVCAWTCSEQCHTGREPGGLSRVAHRRRGSHQLWPRLSLAHPLHTLLLRLLVSAHLQGLQVSGWHWPWPLAVQLPTHRPGLFSASPLPPPSLAAP